MKTGKVHQIFKLNQDRSYEEQNDKNFAAWAPKEGAVNCEEYLDEILKVLNLTVS